MSHNINNLPWYRRLMVVALSASVLSGCVTISDPMVEPPPIEPSATAREIAQVRTPTRTPRATRTRTSATRTVTVSPEITATAVISNTPTITPVPALYTVVEGDTLGVIAIKHAISMDAIMAANGFTDADTLRIGQQIIIPSASMIVEVEAAQGTPIPTPRTESGHLIHWVWVGQTLSQIAEQYGISRDDLLFANGLRPDSQLTAGDRLIIPQGSYTAMPTATALGPTEVPTVVVALELPVSTPVPVEPTFAAPAVMTYTVRAGDVAGVIARENGTTLAALAAANPGVNMDSLSIDQVINLPGATGGAAATPVAGSAVTATPTPEPSATPTSLAPVLLTHTVLTGENYASIATKYGITEESLRSFNQSLTDELSPGTLLLIPMGTPTPTPTSTPIPTATGTPAPAYIAPIPLLPANGSTWVHRASGTPLQLMWASSGILKSDEFYVVRLRAVNEDADVLWSTSHWSQSPSWRLTDGQLEELLAAIPGQVKLRWDIMVMRRTSAAGVEPQTGVALSAKSAVYEMKFIPPSR